MMAPYLIRGRDPSLMETAKELGLSRVRVKQVDEIVDRIIPLRGRIRYATKKMAKKKR
jgi:hypothetical protein